MEKTDFKKTMKALWQPPAGRFTVVEVPRMRFLKIDGKGDPNTAAQYRHAVEWLYSVSYPVKFISKKEIGKDYTVPPLEGLWWAEDMSAFVTGDRSNWLWTMMIMQPDWITQAMIGAGVEKATGKLGDPPASLRLEDYDEGLSVQIMHLGPYSAEAPVIARMHNEFFPENGFVPNGRHHEIYLSDPRKVAPEKMKTVLRQPVRRA